VRGISIPREKIVARRRDRVARVLHSFSLGVFLYNNPHSYVGFIRRSLSDEVMERPSHSVARKRNYVGAKDT
jgi:hypothetical protein